MTRQQPATAAGRELLRHELDADDGAYREPYHRLALAGMILAIEAEAAAPQPAEAVALLPILKALRYPCNQPIHAEAADTLAALATQPAAEAGEAVRHTDEEYAAFKRSEYERIRPAFLTPADPVAKPGLDALDALRWLFEVVQRLDKQAQEPGPDHLVRITTETWLTTVTPAIRKVEARLAAAEREELP